MQAIEILENVWRIYEGDTDYPEFGDDDMQLYFAHLQDAIEEWMNRFPMYRESYAKLADQLSGDKMTSAGVTVYDAPANFVRPANFIKVGDRRLEYIPPQSIALEKTDNPGSNWFSITGHPGAFKIVISFTPGSSMPIEYDYYKTLLVPEESTDLVEVSRPKFCVYYILSQLYLDDEFNKDLVPYYERKMDKEERRARVDLVMNPAGTPNRMNDAGFKRYGSGFGRLARGRN